MKILLLSESTAVEPYAVDALDMDDVAGVLARPLSRIGRLKKGLVSLFSTNPCGLQDGIYNEKTNVVRPDRPATY